MLSYLKVIILWVPIILEIQKDRNRMGLLGFPPRVLFLDPAIKYHFAVLNGTNNLGGCWDSHELFNKNLGKTQAAPSC